MQYPRTLSDVQRAIARSYWLDGLIEVRWGLFALVGSGAFIANTYHIRGVAVVVAALVLLLLAFPGTHLLQHWVVADRTGIVKPVLPPLVGLGYGALWLGVLWISMRLDALDMGMWLLMVLLGVGGSCYMGYTTRLRRFFLKALLLGIGTMVLLLQGWPYPLLLHSTLIIGGGLWLIFGVLAFLSYLQTHPAQPQEEPTDDSQ